MGQGGKGKQGEKGKFKGKGHGARGPRATRASIMNPGRPDEPRSGVAMAHRFTSPPPPQIPRKS